MSDVSWEWWRDQPSMLRTSRCEEFSISPRCWTHPVLQDFPSGCQVPKLPMPTHTNPNTEAVTLLEFHLSNSPAWGPLRLDKSMNKRARFMRVLPALHSLLLCSRAPILTKTRSSHLSPVEPVHQLDTGGGNKNRSDLQFTGTGTGTESHPFWNCESEADSITSQESRLSDQDEGTTKPGRWIDLDWSFSQANV